MYWYVLGLLNTAEIWLMKLNQLFFFKQLYLPIYVPILFCFNFITELKIVFETNEDKTNNQSVIIVKSLDKKVWQILNYLIIKMSD